MRQLSKNTISSGQKFMDGIMALSNEFYKAQLKERRKAGRNKKVSNKK